MDAQMGIIIDLEERVAKLERKQKEKEDKELEWALNQFRYMDKTPDEMKAFAIIQKRLMGDVE